MIKKKECSSRLSAHCTVMRFFKTFKVQHEMAKGARRCIILVVHINNFKVFFR